MMVRFDGFVLDTGQRTLSRDDRRIHLTRKAFDLLAVLIAAAPEVVSKDELHTQVWRGTFITDATLAGVIKELRRALRDSPHPLIRTVHGVGYAFAGAVQTSVADRSSWKCWLVVGERSIALSPGAHDIGRDPRLTVWLDDRRVSRVHARITVTTPTATIEDLGSKNGTLVNDRPIAGRVVLDDGDLIQIGSAALAFRAFDSLATTDTAAND